MDYKLNVVILAAGKGTRMCSDKPKVLHKLAGKSLLQHTIDVAKELNSKKIQVVVGHEAEQIKSEILDSSIDFVLQEDQLGTAHAVEQALPYMENDAIALVLYGDVPLLSSTTLNKMLANISQQNMSILTCDMEDPTGLGRIIRNSKGTVTAIIEHKDASETERLITEINTGIMAIPVNKLREWIPKIATNNAQGEYYLTDLVKIATQDNTVVTSVNCEDVVEANGVNNRLQLSNLERHYQRLQAEKFLLSGISIADPLRIDFRGEITINQDTEIDINVILEGKVEIGKNVKIGANCILKNCTIDDDTNILANTLIEESKIGKACTIGPFARIRPNCDLSEGVKIGNFVELKKVKVANGSKINHLSYIGDSNVGSMVNIGAGTITCNYDGQNKAKTVIKDNVFIGSNSALIAPVTISAGATIGAGSIITKNVDDNQLALSRAKQNNINGWKRPIKKV